MIVRSHLRSFKESQELEEGVKLKAAILGALMAFTGLSASARGYKAPEDYTKDLPQVKSELQIDYPNKMIPKEDLEQMLNTCSETEGLTRDQSKEALSEILASMGFQRSVSTLNKL